MNHKYLTNDIGEDGVNRVMINIYDSFDGPVALKKKLDDETNLEWKFVCYCMGNHCFSTKGRFEPFMLEY